MVCESLFAFQKNEFWQHFISLYISYLKGEGLIFVWRHEYLAKLILKSVPKTQSQTPDEMLTKARGEYYFMMNGSGGREAQLEIKIL